MNDSNAPDVLADSDLVESDFGDRRGHMDIDGPEVWAELNVEFDFVVVVVVHHRVLAHVGVAEVTQDAVCLVSQVFELFRDVLVLDGEDVLVEEVGVECGVHTSSQKLVVVFHFTAALLGLRKALQVLFALVAALELSLEEDLSCGFLLSDFTEVELSVDFSFGLGFDCLGEFTRHLGHSAGSIHGKLVLLTVEVS